jgi:hypothetical protein
MRLQGLDKARARTHQVCISGAGSIFSTAEKEKYKSKEEQSSFGKGSGENLCLANLKRKHHGNEITPTETLCSQILATMFDSGSRA